jgi:hypothetical protein
MDLLEPKSFQDIQTQFVFVFEPGWFKGIQPGIY